MPSEGDKTLQPISRPLSVCMLCYVALVIMQIPASAGGIFFLPANTNCTMVSGKTSDLRIALAHTNLNWGPLTPRGPGSGAPNF